MEWIKLKHINITYSIIKKYLVVEIVLHSSLFIKVFSYTGNHTLSSLQTISKSYNTKFLIITYNVLGCSMGTSELIIIDI